MSPTPETSSPIYPVYPFQRLLTLVETVAPGSANLTAFCALGEVPHRATVHAAAAELLRMHPALRYRFVRRAGDCWQRELPVTAVLDRLVVDLDGGNLQPGPLPPVKLSLVRGPLLRVVAGTGPGGVIALTSCHIVTDRWSLWLLGRDFAAIYAAMRKGGALPSKPSRQFGELVGDDSDRLATGGFDDVFEFWKRELDGVQGIPALAVGRHAQRGDGYRAFELTLTKPDLDSVAAEVRRLAASEFAVLCGFAASAVRSTFEVDDVLVHAMTANRPRRSSWDVVGCFTNSTPLRFQFEGRSRDDLVSNVALALANGAPPSEWIVERLPDTEREVFEPNGRVLEIHVRSDGSPDPRLLKAEPSPVHGVRSCEPANTWGLDLDMMIDLNMQTTRTIRVTYRPERVDAGSCRRVLELLADDLEATSTPTAKVG